MSKETKVMTPEFRLAFPSLFTPTSMEEDQDKKYQIVMLFPKTADLSKLKAAAQKAATEKWGEDKSKWPRNLRNPFRDGDEKSGEVEGYEGMTYITARSTNRPGVVDSQCNVIMDQSEIYGGCFCRATINAFAYSVKGNAGISFGLNNVQKIRDGKAFDGRVKAEDDFTPIEGEEAPEAAEPVDEPAPKAGKKTAKAGSQDDSWMN